MVKDHTARERILHDLDTTMLVEAGAGSGKTTSLVRRMLALIETGTASIEQISAITFTRKAADELKGRFRLELEKRLAEAKDIQAERLSVALQKSELCYIGTIHSFCGQLLRERPIEAKLDPEFREIEEEEAKEFRDQCWDEYITNLSANNGHSALSLLKPLEITVEDLREVYHHVSEYTDVEMDLAYAERPDFDVIRLSLPDMIEEAFKFMPSSKPEKDWDSLQKLVRDGRRMIALHGLEEDQRVLKLALRFDRKIGVILNRWTDTDMAKQLKAAFLNWQTTVLQPFLSSWREYLYPQLIEFVQPVVAYCAQKRRERGLMDFQDLLQRSTSLLREYPAVRQFFARRYTRLLVDEFQDTDPIQAELIFLLSGRGAGYTDWRDITPRPGSLFVVGDPKQSIYRFRRADISTYNFVKSKIRACGAVIQLNANFRSVHSIGDFVNQAFENYFPLEETAHQAAYVYMDTQLDYATTDKTGTGLAHGVRKLMIQKIKYDSKEAITEVDSVRIAQYIAWACAGHLQIQDRDSETGAMIVRPALPSDFLILLKRRELLHVYSEKLEQYGISSVTSGSTVNYEEVVTITLLAQCLNDPDDRIALLAVLRGMLFGVSDSALYQYRKEDFPLAYTVLPERGSVPERAISVYEALEKLAQYAEKVRKEPALTALLFIMNDLGLLARSAIQSGGSNRTGTLMKLLYMLQEDHLNAASWPALTSYLLKLIKNKKMEAVDLFAGQQNAVRIMNLHKAKGLEAPVVFLAGPCGNLDHDTTVHVDRSSGAGIGYFSITRKKGYQTEVIAHPPRWTELKEKERLFMNAEQERLLYVAATRAKQLLVISQYPDKPAIDPWSGFDNHLLETSELGQVQIDPVEADIYDGLHNEAADEAMSQDHRAQLAKSTYRITTVTELAKSNVEQPPRPLQGRGMAFGSTVHRSIELISRSMSDPELEKAIQTIAVEEGMDDQFLPDVRKMLQAVTSHEIWRRSAVAKRRFHELSIRTKRDIDNSDETGVQMILKGAIDFLFEEEDGWVLVDFKTDVYEEDALRPLVDFYRPQVEAYAIELHRSFGMHVKEVGLHFLHGNEYVVV